MIIKFFNTTLEENTSINDILFTDSIALLYRCMHLLLRDSSTVPNPKFSAEESRKQIRPVSSITSVNTHKRHCQYRTPGRTVKLFSMYTWANRTIKECRTLNIEDRRLNSLAARTNVESVVGGQKLLLTVQYLPNAPPLNTPLYVIPLNSTGCMMGAV